MTKIPIIDEDDLNRLVQEAINGNGILATPKEISQMVTYIKGISINSTPRKDGRYQGYIEEKGEKKYVYGKTKDEVALKIKNLLKNGLPQKKERNIKNGVPTTFNAFAMYYFENFRKKKVVANTFKADLCRYNKHIKPVFNEMPIKSIIPLQVQKLVDSLTNDGKGKTCDEIISLLNNIFKMAIKHSLITHNPVDVIFHEPHERETGTPLTIEEIKAIINEYKGTKYLDCIMTYLYTGLRPSELQTARIDGQFIIAENQKQKDKKLNKIHYKKIPIVKELLPYLKNGIVACPQPYLIIKIKKVANHTIKDLRTTFYSQCEKCNINIYALKKMVGHSLGKLGNAYTGFNDEFLIEEMKKFRYEI